MSFLVESQSETINSVRSLVRISDIVPLDEYSVTITGRFSS